MSWKIFQSPSITPNATTVDSSIRIHTTPNALASSSSAPQSSAKAKGDHTSVSAQTLLQNSQLHAYNVAQRATVTSMNSAYRDHACCLLPPGT